MQTKYIFETQFVFDILIILYRDQFKNIYSLYCRIDIKLLQCECVVDATTTSSITIMLRIPCLP